MEAGPTLLVLGMEILVQWVRWWREDLSSVIYRKGNGVENMQEESEEGVSLLPELLFGING